MVVVSLERGDPFAYEPGLGLALTVADLAADLEGSPQVAGVAPVGVVVLISALPQGAGAETTLKRLKQLELYEVQCLCPMGSDVKAVLPFVQELAKTDLREQLALLAAQHATFMAY